MPPTPHTVHLSPWGRLVAVSAVLVVGALVAFGALALASSRERVISYPVRGSLSGVVLDLADADVTVARGGRATEVRVERTERFAFGHGARSRREIAAGVLRITARCPETVLHTCSASYRIVVPDNVPVDVRTGAGGVRLAGYRGSARIATRSGDVSVEGFCGFALQARAESGNIAASASCAPQELSLRSTRGSVHAIVPPGRYQLDAETAAGRQTVRGITEVADAPFSIQALSSSGDVSVEARP